jgi:outer membrane protein TolC
LLPRVNAVGTYQYSFDIQTQMIPAEMFGGLSGTYKEARLGVNQNKSESLQASQTLYNAPLLISLKIAKATVNLECLQIQGTKEDLIYNVSATYYNIQSILKQEQLVENNLRSMNSLVEITDRLYKSGLATATDANRLTVSRDNTSANLRKLRNNKEKMYNLLKILMNIPIDSNIQIKEFQENKSSLVEPFQPVFFLQKE